MKRKGITPVIAVVLLLLITVGAVASAWGLYQQITSNQQQVDQLNARQAASSTEISADTVYESSVPDGDTGYIMATLRNTGSEAVNLSMNGSDVELQVSPPGDSNYYGPALYMDEDRNLVDTNFADVEDNNCFWNEGEVLSTDSSEDCNTTIQYPSAGQTYDFQLTYQNVDGYSWDFSCSPSSNDDIRCD